MAILNPDGSVYQASGQKALNHYRPGLNADQNQFDKWDSEQIRIGGSLVIYYPIIIDSNYDEIYMESMDSIIAQEGYKLYAQFQPVRPLQAMTMFGLDSADEILMNFNLTDWNNTVGHWPKPKGLVFCEWNNTWWEITQGDGEPPYKLWKRYRLQIAVHKYQPSRGDKQPTRKDSGDIGINIY